MMTPADMHDAIEAQFLMGHLVPAAHWDGYRTSGYSWDEDQVRCALAVPLDDTWGQRVLELELQGLASFCLYSEPVEQTPDGTWHEIPGWQDAPREEYGSVGIFARGVLRLADRYGRPYVRWHESPALVRHWQLVQREAEARLHAPHDEARWAREYPERALMWQAHLEALARRVREEEG